VRLAAVAVATLVVIIGVGIVVGGGLLPASGTSVPHFTDETAASGIDHAYTGGFHFFTGGGVAAFDCNGDGLPDLYFAGGEGPAALYQNDSTVGGPLRFHAVAEPAVALDSVVGAYPLDVDGDGVTDLAVLRFGENVLLRGLGNCQFERANEAWGFDGGDVWSSAFSATWESGANWPTLAVGNYVDDTAANGYTSCYDNDLYRPADGSSSFAAPAPLSPGWCALSMLFSSWDRSGRADLRVSNDRHYYGETSGGQEQLWRVAPGEAPRLYTAADGWQPLRIWGMGIADYDVNGDGFPDYFLTSQGDDKLQMLVQPSAGPDYHDTALSFGVTATRPYAGDTTLPSTSWNPAFADVNNDGHIDLFVSKGNVEAEADYAMLDPSDLFLGQPDGTFADAAQEAGIQSFDRARGAALVDLNLDGLLDLVEVNREEPATIWQNMGAGDDAHPTGMGHWLGIQLSEEGANRDAIGAWVDVRAGDLALSHEQTVGGGQAGGQLGPIHFGLGSADHAQVRVTWPDGTQGPWIDVPADRYVTIERDLDTAQPWPSTR
jgi:enediyne biosynthesis protein E4